MTPDVNVLVAASRSDHVHHAVALEWLRGALDASERGQRFELLPMVASGFLRLVTHACVFPDPTPPRDAWAFLDAILSVAGVRLTSLGGEWGAFRRLCEARGLSGNAVPDAWIAASVKATGLHLVTFDRGFADLLDDVDYTLLKV